MVQIILHSIKKNGQLAFMKYSTQFSIFRVKKISSFFPPFFQQFLLRYFSIFKIIKMCLLKKYFFFRLENETKFSRFLNFFFCFQQIGVIIQGVSLSPLNTRHPMILKSHLVHVYQPKKISDDKSRTNKCKLVVRQRVRVQRGGLRTWSFSH